MRQGTATPGVARVWHGSQWLNTAEDCRGSTPWAVIVGVARRGWLG